MPDKVVQYCEFNRYCGRCEIADRIDSVGKNKKSGGLQAEAEQADNIELYPVRQ